MKQLTLPRVTIKQEPDCLTITHKQTGRKTTVAPKLLDNWAVNKLRADALQDFSKEKAK
jgi:hypothetical protein